MNKIGTITVDVYKEDCITSFDIKSDNEDVLPIQYVIEDVLKLY